jgi:hypothetical protein
MRHHDHVPNHGCSRCSGWPVYAQEIVFYLIELGATMTALSDAIATLQSTDADLAANLSTFETDVTNAISDLQAKIDAGDSVTAADLANLAALAKSDSDTSADVSAQDATVTAADPGAPVDTPPAA